MTKETFETLKKTNGTIHLKNGWIVVGVENESLVMYNEKWSLLKRVDYRYVKEERV